MVGGRLVLAAVLALAAHAAVQMPVWFGDNMVLQTNSEYGARSFLNGKASPGEMVSVNVSGGMSHFGGSYSAVADSSGDWVLQLNPSSKTSPCDIEVQGDSDENPVVARGVLFGDVFFCSGQSNMVFPLKLAYNLSQERSDMNQSQFKDFRFFMTARGYSSAPQWDLNGTACDANTPANCNKWLTAAQSISPSAGVPDLFLDTFSAVCYMTVRDIAKLHTGTRPMALIQSAWGGTRVEAWMSAEAIKANQFGSKVPARPSQNQASVLYNAMVAPWNKFAIRAALWYQGEANADEKIAGVDQTQYYASMLQGLIADWREHKGMGDFGFVSMQLPPSVAPGTGYSQQMATGRMEIRLAEALTSAHAGGGTDISGVAVGLDMGGKSAWGYDHPPNKNEMSRRLALQMLHTAYATQTPLWTGPVLVHVLGSGADLELELESATSQAMALKDVRTVNPDGSWNNCTLCCAQAAPFDIWDGDNWTAVTLAKTKVEGSSIRLVGAAGAKAVRYGWRDFVECVVYNGQGLPLGPFEQAVGASRIRNLRPPAATLGPIQSPPMGFNSWNFYHCNIDENTVKAIVDAMASNGMKEAGYEYVNIDDCWQVERNSDGSIQPDPVRFPSGIKALADYAHSKGLKFGVYTARGSRTCQNRPGAYQHELQDAATYCGWGLDYLKNDNCGGSSYPEANTSWSKFQQGFDECYRQTGRYIVKSVEYCKDPSGCGQWIGGVANLWRTTSDVQSTWQSVMSNIHEQNNMSRIAKPGNFNDPDMLQVGNVGLTLTEQYTHMSLWSIAGAPLLAGTDLIHASSDTLAILANKEVTAINQDLGLDGAIQGVIVTATPTAEVWCKKLADGNSVAVVLLNLGDKAANLTADWGSLGLHIDQPATVRDLWHRATLGVATRNFTAHDVPGHGAAFVKITTNAPRVS